MKKWCMYYGALLMRGVLNVLNLFPVKKDRIVFYSFNGKNCACNPYYISEALAAQPDVFYDMIWSFKDPDAWRPVVPKGCRVVRFRSLRHYFYMKTARVVVYNVQEEGEIARRKGQVFIQTWHASNGYKKVSYPKDALEKKKMRLSHKNYSYVLSGCRSMTERRVRHSMNFQGEVLQGTPRMDVLVNQNRPDCRQKVLDSLQISGDTRILLYAPTWRKNRGAEEYGLDYAALKEALEQKFGGTWMILVRFHPNMTIEGNIENAFVKNVTKYPDMQELIYTADAMISDYSSCVWDYSFTYRPCFLYWSDFEQSGGNEMLEIPIEEWGFPLCRSTEELLDAIRCFDAEDYVRAVRNHHEQMGSYEDGHATERVCGLIRELMA